ncbi:HIT domain-containing protein [Amycolatopsis sp. NPDC049159]|uniref:HIT family protein n=1 Tax=unclassified Amycolatopsis TaxID=2618356 RepID=UPI0033E96E53
MPEPCPICAKHRGNGPLTSLEVWSDDLVVVSHGAEPGFFGYLFVETRRHVACLDALTGPEALAVGRAAWLAARALRAELDAESLHSAVTGRTVPHFHQHVFVRHRGTPPEAGWMDVALPSAPHDERVDLCGRLRPHFDRP